MVDQSDTSYYGYNNCPWDCDSPEERDGVCHLAIPIPIPAAIAMRERTLNEEWKKIKALMDESFEEYQKKAEELRESEYHKVKRENIDGDVDWLICRLFGFKYRDNPLIVREDRCDWRSDLEKVLHGEFVDSYFDMDISTWELKDGARTYMIYIDCPCTVYGYAETDRDEDGPYEVGFEITDDDALMDVPDDIRTLLGILGTDITVELE